MNPAKLVIVSTYELRRRINRALARSSQSLWYPDSSKIGPFTILAGNVVQATGLSDLEALARRLGVMSDQEVWGDRASGQ